eukprot:379992_1
MSQVAITTVFTGGGINLVVSSFASLHNFMLLIYHIQTILKILKNTEQKLHRTYFLSITSMGTIVLFNISVVLLYLIDIYKVNIASCNTRAGIGIIIFLLSKVALYLLLFERLFVIFRNSQFKFSKIKIILTRVILCSLTMTVIVPIIFEKNSEIYSNGVCATNVKLYLKAAFVLIDLGISVWIMILFSRRLWLLSLNTNRNREESSMMSGSSQYTHTHTKVHNLTPNSFDSPKQKKKYIQKMNKQLLRVMTKTNLLTLIAIITTEMAMVVSSFIPGTIWPIIDSMVNCWCVLLMFKSHERIFDCVCKYASNIISDHCLIICACPCCVQLDETDIEIIEETVTDNGNGNDNSDNDGTPIPVSKMLTPPASPKMNVIHNNVSLENVKVVEMEAVSSMSGVNDNTEQSDGMKLEIDNMNDTHFKFGMEHDLDEQVVEIGHDHQNSTHL